MGELAWRGKEQWRLLLHLDRNSNWRLWMKGSRICSFFLLRATLKFTFSPSPCTWQNFGITESSNAFVFCFILSVIKLKAGVFLEIKPLWIYDKFILSWNVLLFASQVDGREKTYWKVQMRTGRGHSPNTIISQTDSTWGY